MTVREFNGSTDFVRLNIGSLSGATHGTFAAIFKADDTAVNRTLISFLDSAQSFVWHPFQLDGADAMVWFSGGTSHSPVIPQGVWVLLVARKASGTAAPRYSYYNFNTTTWSHGNFDTTLANATAPGAGGFVSAATSGTDSEPWDGRLAVTAGWSNAVHWSADTTGDSQIEAAGLEDSLQNWVDESPDALWPWNPAVAAGVADIIGAADQAAISGTTAVEGDDPPGFSFDLGPGPPAPDLIVVRSGVTLA